MLIAYPGPLVRGLVWKRADVVVFDEAGFWVLDRAGAERACHDPFSLSIDWTRADAPRGIVEALKYWSPIWTRWVAHADQYERLYREAAFYVLHVQEGLTRFGVTSAVFHTSASHHVDASLLEIACGRRGVVQHFFYRNVVTNRLQILSQTAGMPDRRPWASPVSGYEAGADIAAFRERRLEGRPPAHNHYGGWAHRSFVCGVADACYITARSYAVRTIKRSRQHSKAARFFDQFAELGLSDFLRLMTTQKRAIRYFEARRSQEPVAALVARHPSSPVPLIAAHYQPEATSFPEGGEFDNHIDIAARLRVLGCEGPVLYKEHSASADYYADIVHQTRVGAYRSVSYYERLEELGCVFTDPSAPVPLDSDLNRRMIPVTITGTIAAERSLLGLKTLVAGYPWYRGLPGAVELRTLDSLARVDLEPDAALGDEASAFLGDMLSRRTLVNAPGIGSGAPLADCESQTAFQQEFGSFLEQL